MLLAAGVGEIAGDDREAIEHGNPRGQRDHKTVNRSFQRPDQYPYDQVQKSGQCGCFDCPAQPIDCSRQHAGDQGHQDHLCLRPRQVQAVSGAQCDRQGGPGMDKNYAGFDRKYHDHKGQRNRQVTLPQSPLQPGHEQKEHRDQGRHEKQCKVWRDCKRLWRGERGPGDRVHQRTEQDREQAQDIQAAQHASGVRFNRMQARGCTPMRHRAADAASAAWDIRFCHRVSTWFKVSASTTSVHSRRRARGRRRPSHCTASSGM